MTLPMLSTPEAMLEWLGSSQTPDEVAEKLRELGVKGEPSEPCLCPIANALALAGAHIPRVYPDTKTGVWVAAWFDVPLYELPGVVGEFAQAFDEYDCRWPDLILEQAS